MDAVPQLYKAVAENPYAATAAIFAAAWFWERQRNVKLQQAVLDLSVASNTAMTRLEVTLDGFRQLLGQLLGKL